MTGKKKTLGRVLSSKSSIGSKICYKRVNKGQDTNRSYPNENCAWLPPPPLHIPDEGGNDFSPIRSHGPLRVGPFSDRIWVSIRSTQRRLPPKYVKNIFQAIQSSFRFLEIHSKRRYKLCIRSIILGHFESFRNFKGFSIIFPKVLDAIYRFTKVTIFLIPTSITFLSPKILYFLFLRKNSITTGVKCEKLGLENRREFIR